MQKIISVIPLFLLGLSSFSNLTDEPFKYKYQIVANSNSPSDIYDLYDYKERVIDIYEDHYLYMSQKEIEKDLVENIEIFKLNNDVRPYYAYGTIVLMVGNANGMCLEGSLRKDSCDDSVIRTKVFIFDLFS